MVLRPTRSSQDTYRGKMYRIYLNGHYVYGIISLSQRTFKIRYLVPIYDDPVCLMSADETADLLNAGYQNKIRLCFIPNGSPSGVYYQLIKNVLYITLERSFILIPIMRFDDSVITVSIKYLSMLKPLMFNVLGRLQHLGYTVQFSDSVIASVSETDKQEMNEKKEEIIAAIKADLVSEQTEAVVHPA